MRLVALFFLLSVTFLAHPASRQCQSTDPSAPDYQAPPLFSPDNQLKTYIGANYSSTLPDGTTVLTGNIDIKKNQLYVHADKARYDQQKDFLQVTGNVHIDTPSLSLDASKATFSLSNSANQGTFTHTKFILPAENKKRSISLKGTAGSITTGSNHISTLHNASITSCNLNSPDWLISAKKITINHNKEYGSAHNVIMRFKGVPFLYTPYIQFPTSNKRRSGLLFPEFGTSSSRGLEFAQPWYWNIAPNMDATITPHFMAKRGIELGGEYRYLTKSSHGSLHGAYLHRDRISQQKRYQVRYQQYSTIMPNLSMAIDLQDISDKDYFNDFSNNLNITSQTHLDRSARLNYDTQDWHMRTLVQKIKTIDTSSPLATRPYARLPQLTLNGETAVGKHGIQFTLDSELVEFRHEDNNKPTGSRITLRPGFYWPLSGAAWFFDPAIKFSHTQYNVGPDNGSKQRIEDRNLPVSSIDTGLFFERTLSNGLVQTLEPRLYYLKVPYKAQNNIPLFDTSIPDFSIAQLFRDNRFIGGDRIGDANQLTIALTSRLINPVNSKQSMRASIGQILYFNDRRVSIDGTTDSRRQSDIIAELATQAGAWSGNIDLQWDADANRFSKENYLLHYQTDNRHIFNFGYRKRLKNNTLDLQQTDTSLVMPINARLSAYARWNYSLKDNKNINTITGLSYDNCCWSLQLLAQRRLQNSTTDNLYESSILVQFVLKGLGNIAGSKARHTLEQSIYGYHDILQ